MKPTLPHGPSAALRSVARALVGVLYPPLCLGCDARLPDTADDRVLCPACLRTIPDAVPGALRLRLDRLPSGPNAFGHTFALWLFDEGGIVQRVQHVAKYGNRPSLGVRLGRRIGEARRRTDAPEPDLVVPVPLHRSRRIERGYNQSQQLAAGIADALGVPLRPGLLVRRRPTQSQTKLSQTERWTNVADAFELADVDGSGTVPALDGQRVLLVDDVATTGATVVAATAPLRAAGATVDLAVLACTRD